ncbi:MAG: 30S ribosomal protein S17 [Bdellovibrionaceae bacterium]|nr:30S ribosomal protein S17 [Pseudobdellovibrionaceae bacterium]
MTKVKKERGRKNEVVGRVVSDKMDKTITVEADRMVRHEKYGKFVRRTTVFKAHDEKNEAKVGDKVKILESRALSKTKRWKLQQILEKAEATEAVPS